MASKIISQRLVTGLRPSACCVRPLHNSRVVGGRVSKIVKAAAADAPPIAEVITDDPSNNVTENIFNKIGVKLHRQRAHPLNNIKDAIYEFFDSKHKKTFNKFDDLFPIVSTEANFDSVLVPQDHVSRSPNDTYYVSADSVLRCAIRSLLYG
jgi:phenylalanyl-tRNA synthetase alpha subunit